VVPRNFSQGSEMLKIKRLLEIRAGQKQEQPDEDSDARK